MKKKKKSNVILPPGELAERYRQKRNYVAKYNYHRGGGHKSEKDYNRKKLRKKLKDFLNSFPKNGSIIFCDINSKKSDLKNIL